MVLREKIINRSLTVLKRAKHKIHLVKIFVPQRNLSGLGSWWEGFLTSPSGSWLGSSLIRLVCSLGLSFLTPSSTKGRMMEILFLSETNTSEIDV